MNRYTITTNPPTQYPALHIGKIQEEEYEEMGDWAGPRDLFPTFTIDNSGEINIKYFSVCNRKHGQYGQTHSHSEEISPSADLVRIRGLVGLRSGRHRTGGRQQFCFFVFRDREGIIRTHRATVNTCIIQWYY